ncbi:UNVERIFIED_CONTAM: hypothetical protein Scaly_2919100 [Sesamum calycinum]|uniref:RNase H type-1 domain-containing protein n=1 Tax=Sesamum calycinum TaxID=2727403 RepID=A0AAW2KYT9_9LAMI
MEIIQLSVVLKLVEQDPLPSWKEGNTKNLRYHREYGHNNNCCRHLWVEQQDEDPHKKEHKRKEALGGEMSPEDVPGNSTAVPFYKVYQPMELGYIPLEPVDTLLRTMMFRLLVVDMLSAYNLVSGRPALNTFQVIVSTYHMKLKFLIGDEVAEFKGEVLPNRMARKGVPTRVQPAEELLSIQLVLRLPDKVTKIGSQLSPALAGQLTVFLQQNINIFSCTANDLVSNNEVAYEAFIIAIRIALDAGANSLIAYSDSKLVKNQVESKYEVKKERMKEYLQEIDEFTHRLTNFQITISRQQKKPRLII